MVFGGEYTRCYTDLYGNLYGAHFSKSVCEQSHVGSNPTRCAKAEQAFCLLRFLSFLRCGYHFAAAFFFGFDLLLLMLPIVIIIISTTTAAPMIMTLVISAGRSTENSSKFALLTSKQR